MDDQIRHTSTYIRLIINDNDCSIAKNTSATHCEIILQIESWTCFRKDFLFPLPSSTIVLQFRTNMKWCSCLKLNQSSFILEATQKWTFKI